jgi:hypothetical protein
VRILGVLWIVVGCGRANFDTIAVGDGAVDNDASGIAPEVGLLGRWRFDEGSGSVAFDSSGNGRSGVLTDRGGGAPSWSATGRVSGALQFPGNGSVLVGDGVTDSPLDFRLGDAITIAAWIRPMPFNSRWGAILNKGTYDADDSNYSFFQGNEAGAGAGDLSFVITAGNDNYNNMGTDQVVLTEGVWQHVAITFTFGSSASAVFYVNGVPYPAFTNFGNMDLAPTQNDAPLILGDTNQPEPFTFTGGIDDLRLYNRVLSASEILDMYADCDDGSC